jgi:lactoylglutathione lyase
MKIEHIAIWSKDIERLRDFYTKYFGAEANDKYTNEKKGFSSYFLSFGEGCRIEVMQKPDLAQGSDDRNTTYGYAHIALSVGDNEDVIRLTERLESDGFTIASRPRYTGDGYFESAVLDPDGNLVEITID